MKKLMKMFQDESGITALETAIILIAFVVVASVFAFTMLSAGTFSTERGKEAIYAGLAEVRGSLEVRGGMIAKGVTSTNTISEVVFTLANVAGGEPVDFTDTPGSQVVVIEYRDAYQRSSITNWTVTWLGYRDPNNNEILEERELAEITVPLTGLATKLGPNSTFVIEVKPPKGAVINLQRTTPSNIDPVMELN